MADRVALVIGASRGMGRQIAIDLARDGYTVVVAAKSTSDARAAVPWPPDPNSPQSTISTVVREIHEAGGKATAMTVDVRDPVSVKGLVEQTVALHSRVDVMVYNAGAIWWASVAQTPPTRFALMQAVNPGGLYAAVHALLPILPADGRIVVVCPPIYSRFFRGKTAYAMGKVGMSVLVAGLAMDWQREGAASARRAISGLWPASSIESAATQHNFGSTRNADLRRPTIFSDAVLALLRAPASLVNGLLTTDEDFLRAHGGVTDFAKYSVVPGANPRRIMPLAFPDLRVAEQDDEGQRVDSTVLRAARGGAVPAKL